MSARRRFYHSVRFKLLLVSLTLLGIPWAGYQLIQETETFLRQSQEDGLTGLSQAIALSLAGLAGEFGTPLASGSRFPHRDLYLHELTKPPVLDGYREDWAAIAPNLAWLGEPGSQLRAGVHVGQLGGDLYLSLAVIDQHVLYRREGGRELPRSDRVMLSFVDRGGRLQRWLVAPYAPGSVRAAPVLTGADGNLLGAESYSIQGAWQEHREGYTLELRLPAAWVAGRLAVRIDDLDGRTGSDAFTSIATSDRGGEVPGRLVGPSGKLQRQLGGLVRPGLRLWVTDASGLVLAQTGQLDLSAPLFADADNIPWLIRKITAAMLRHQAADKAALDPSRSRLDAPEVSTALRGRPASHRRAPPGGEAVVVSAASPVLEAGQVIGAVLVEQTTTDILSLQNLALQRIVTITLILFAVLALALLGFASVLIARIRRLRDRVEAAVTHDGRIVAEVPAARGRDEIGDLGRSFASVLTRLQGYNRYLEQMASRLAHELRTPLSVVRSSLDNCEQLPNAAEHARYLARAREGAERLDLILRRLREASRLEQALASVEPETFDLRGLVIRQTDSLRELHPDIDLVSPPTGDPLIVTGAPDLVCQALEKLVSNAVDFHRPGTPIRVAIAQGGEQALLSVSNQGPPLPSDIDPFQSMVSLRGGDDGEPHLGLGLYLVRLIAAFHGGDAEARNLDDGVEITLSLARHHGGKRLMTGESKR